MNNEQRIWLFNTEIGYITDQKLKEFIETVICNADDYFFSVPASSSGKYHPQFALGEMGLVRHTKAVVYFFRELIGSQLFDIDEYCQQLLTIACIAHDIKKQGDGKGNHTVKNHPELAAQYIEDLREKNKKILSKKDCDYICKAIRSHMGVWGDPKPVTLPEKLVHLADLLASRRDIDLKFGQEELIMDYYEDKPLNTENPQIIEQKSDKSPKKVTIKNYICTFGKYKGKKLEEISEDYMQWAIDNNINQTEFIEMAKKYLKKKNK